MATGITQRIRENIIGVFALAVIFTSLAAAGGIAYNIFTIQPTAVGTVPTDLFITINNGQDFSTSQDVNLTLFANNAEECRYMNSEDPDWNEWEPYSLEKEWKLNAGDGQHAVLYQCRNTELSNSIGLAIITLDTTAPTISYTSQFDNSTLNLEMEVFDAISDQSICTVKFGSQEDTITIELNSGIGKESYSTSPAGDSFQIICYDEAGNNAETPVIQLVQ
ncbi:hypothetical protein KJ780_04325 [Candidatus Micrarchaeota archaeon]|nr:hypothetical protein [Candidatus Micrarchaeota archaeon]